MDIVYVLINKTRASIDLEPTMYIGSKRDCKVKDGQIIDSKGACYWSSSKYVKESIKNKDEWELSSWFDVGDKNVLDAEALEQRKASAVKSPKYYNKSYANKKFDSSIEGVGDAIRNSKLGIVKPHMLKKDYWQRLHTKEARKKSSESRKGNKKVIDAAIKRNAKWAECPEYRKRRSEISRKASLGRKKTEHEIWLRMHDDRYKSNRKLSNEQVWRIRFGDQRDLNLNCLCSEYPEVSKATLCRVRNFKVFKDITERWKNET